jgi:two-component system chemotaxis response regulator CheB
MVLDPDRTIKILVVDDSAFMCKAITMMLESDPQIKVIGSARDGAEGIEKVKLLKPDLVTMDIEMPRMDGLTALREIMRKNPVPVMMISSITTEGAKATLDALEAGAVDFIPKQMSSVSLDIVKFKDDLLSKIKDITRRKSMLMAQFRRKRYLQISGRPSSGEPDSSARPAPRRVIRKKSHNVRIVAVGVSTGGPPALQTIIPQLPRNLPVGVVVAQHMPPTFTKSLADRLDGASQVSVREAENGEPVQPGLVLFAPGGKHISLEKKGSQTKVVVSSHPEESLYHPCIDILMDSVADAYGQAAMGVILTGMGSNGVVGLTKLKKLGGVTIAQDEETSVVYGMPRAVVEAGIVDHVAPVEDIAHEILAYF